MYFISVSIRKVEVKMHFKAKIRIYNVQDFQPIKSIIDQKTDILAFSKKNMCHKLMVT